MRRVGGKWTILILLTLGIFLAQGARQIFNSVLPLVADDFAASGVTDTQLGLIGSAFALTFGLCLPFAGVVSDFLSRKRMIVCGVLLFSIGILCAGFTTGIVLLVLTYGVVNGIGQSMLPPANSSLIGQLHVRTRGTAFAVYQTGIYVGTIVLSCASGWLAVRGSGGWRTPFLVFGAIGLVWAFVLAVFLHDTKPEEIKGKDEKGESEEGRPSVREAVLAMLGKPTAVLLMLALGFYFYALYGFKTWLPMYMVKVFPGVSVESAAFHGVFWFYIGAFLGVVTGGRLSDRLYAVRRSVRIEMNILGLVLTVPFLLGMAYAPTFVLCVVASGLFGFATGLYDSNLYASLMEVVDPRYRAAAVGMFGCGGCVLGALGPGMLGWVSTHFTMRTGFATLAFAAFAGVLILLFARCVTLRRDCV